MTLPHNELIQLGLLNNQMMGANAVFPGPATPQVAHRNSVQLLGSYLHQYQFQMQRLLPYLQKLSELMQRENLLTDVNDRMETQNLSHHISESLQQIISSTQPVISLFQNLQMGNRPGEFRIIGS